MSEMEERICFAIGPMLEEVSEATVRAAARAAVVAMREPTPVMIAAIENMAEERFNAAPSFQRFYGDYLWRAGIDAALAEKETK